MASPTTSEHGQSELTRPQYKKPPLAEAVIELRCDMLPEAKLGALQDLRRALSTKYPKEEALTASQIQIEFTATGAKPVGGSAEPLGVQITSADSSERVQLRRNGISFHKLPPYARWEDCRDEARGLWQHYVTAVEPGRVRQLGVRYINRFLVAAPFEIKDYLRTYPEVSSDLPQYLSGYVMQLSLPQPDMQGTTLVQRQAIVEPPAPNQAQVILDNDLVMRGDFDASGDEVWQALELLHRRQNHVFESCITDATRELFD